MYALVISPTIQISGCKEIRSYTPEYILENQLTMTCGIQKLIFHKCAGYSFNEFERIVQCALSCTASDCEIVFMDSRESISKIKQLSFPYKIVFFFFKCTNITIKESIYYVKKMA